MVFITKQARDVPKIDEVQQDNFDFRISINTKCIMIWLNPFELANGYMQRWTIIIFTLKWSFFTEL